MINETRAALPPEFRNYLDEHDGMMVFHHPFAIRVGMKPDMVPSVLDWIRDAQAGFDACCAAKNWTCALLWVMRPYRLEYLEKLIDMHGIQRLLLAVGYVWSDTESAYDESETWDWIWSRVKWRKDGQLRKTRDRVMSLEERAFLASLPSTIRVYRGFCGEGGEHGFSWTLDREQAEWFARRFPEDGLPYVAAVTISKADALAYFDREKEIVLDPWSLDQIKIEGLPLDRQAA
ncbi:hypothetical protein GIY56_00685 [Paracoccus sp. YIM 132242]|uniref:Uncharacterized protein n=2 Tax=Paracoccus lichenicola TaxID=2665644 RepID=A0A6L6HKM6_9RHOB|nr:hypothetical protein [Paracoccus lichenicola]